MNVTPMTDAKRHAAYIAQNGGGALTPRQRRRSEKKRSREMLRTTWVDAALASPPNPAEGVTV